LPEPEGPSIVNTGTSFSVCAADMEFDGSEDAAF